MVAFYTNVSSSVFVGLRKLKSTEEREQICKSQCTERNRKIFENSNFNPIPPSFCEYNINGLNC